MNYNPGLLKAIDSFLNTRYTYFLPWTKTRKRTKRNVKKILQGRVMFLVSQHFLFACSPCDPEPTTVTLLRLVWDLQVSCSSFFSLSSVLTLEWGTSCHWEKEPLGIRKTGQWGSRFPGKRKLGNPEKIKQSMGARGWAGRELQEEQVGFLLDGSLPQFFLKRCTGIALCLSPFLVVA